MKVENPATKSTGRGRLEPEPEPLSSSASMLVILVSFESPVCALSSAFNGCRNLEYGKKEKEAAGCTMQRCGG